jgi:hypothetical protein
MVDARKFFGVTFAKLEDVDDGPEQKVVAAVEEGKFEKLNLIFDDGSALSLNATNTRALSKAFGPETDDWPGHAVELYAGEIEYQGKPQPAVLVRSISAAPAANDDKADKIPF